MTSTQNKKITVDIRESLDAVVYYFNGEIDSEFDTLKMTPVRKKIIIFDLEHIININSLGIKQWISFVKKFSGIGELIFRKCSIPVIDQLNMIPSVIGAGKIESFFAPYFCDCSGEIAICISFEEYRDTLARGDIPEFKCKHCGGALTFDDIGESYFKFAKDMLNNAG
ncbi:MAG: hypothetical protein HQK54_07010 [Oligoflexales bacterium]|nr:hypothetical protein [Oligoflexales bacterium]